MTSGSLLRRGIESAARIAIGLLVALAVPAQAAGWTVDTLMQRLAANRSGSARFTEQKFIAMVDKPIVSRGELRYAAPDRLEKITTHPKPESLVLADGVLTIDRAGKTQQFRLAEQPELAAFVESIRGTLTGDRQALERYYQLTLDGTEQRWALTLVPKQARMLAVARQLRMEGRGGELRTVEIEQPGSDRSVLQIEKAAP